MNTKSLAVETCRSLFGTQRVDNTLLVYALLTFGLIVCWLWGLFPWVYPAAIAGAWFIVLRMLANACAWYATPSRYRVRKPGQRRQQKLRKKVASTKQTYFVNSALVLFGLGLGSLLMLACKLYGLNPFFAGALWLVGCYAVAMPFDRQGLCGISKVRETRFPPGPAEMPEKFVPEEGFKRGESH